MAMGLRYLRQGSSAQPWPNQTTTGTTGSLTAYTGPMNITVDNTVIENKIIDGQFAIEANNVIIRNCLVRNFGYWGILNQTGVDIRIERCEVDGGGAMNSTGIGAGIGAGAMIIGNNVHSTTIGIQNLGGGTVYGNYVHDLESESPDPDARHFDGIAVFGGGPVLIDNNAVILIPESGGTSCIFLACRFNNITGVTVRNNLLMGDPAYTLYLEDSGGMVVTGCVVEGNSIDKGVYGPIIYDTAEIPVTVGNTTWIHGVDPTPAAVQGWLDSA